MKALLTFIISSLLSSPTWAFTLCIENADYSPFLIGTEGAKSGGVLVDMAKLAAAENQQPLELIAHPWKRCIDMVQKGRADALMASIWAPERDVWGAFPKLANGLIDRSKRLWTVDYPIFVPLQSKLTYNDGQFGNVRYKLSAPTGYVAWQRLKSEGVLSDLVLSPEQGLKLVALNRLDGYVIQRNIGEHQLMKLGLGDQVSKLQQSYITDDWYLVFSHQFQTAQPQLTQQLWTSLGKIREKQGPALLKAYEQEAKRQQAKKFSSIKNRPKAVFSNTQSLTAGDRRS